MAASTSILTDKLHEYPQQDVIDGAGGEAASILDDLAHRLDGATGTTERPSGFQHDRQHPYRSVE